MCKSTDRHSSWTHTHTRDNNSYPYCSSLRTVHCHSCGMEHCSPAPLQVGWRRSGIGLWSASGCRLFCSLRQTPLRTSTPMGLTSAKLMPMTLEVAPFPAWHARVEPVPAIEHLIRTPVMATSDCLACHRAATITDIHNVTSSAGEQDDVSAATA